MSKKERDWTDLGTIGFLVFIIIATLFSISRFELDVAIDTIAIGFLYTLGVVVMAYALWVSGVIESIVKKIWRRKRK